MLVLGTRNAHARGGYIQCFKHRLWRSSRIHRTVVTSVTFVLRCLRRTSAPKQHSHFSPTTPFLKNLQRKEKNCSRNSAVVPAPATAPPSKRARVPEEAASFAYLADNDPMVSALNNIQSLLATMNSRIQVLESGATHSAGPSSSAGGMLPSSLSTGPAHGPAGSSPFAGPAHGPTGVAPDDDVTAARSDGITFPRRMLGTAVPISTGVPFFPPAAEVSQHLRSQILAGNDVNLIKILLCSEISDRRIVDCGDVSVILKESDPRLSKTLTLAEI